MKEKERAIQLSDAVIDFSARIFALTKTRPRKIVVDKDFFVPLLNDFRVRTCPADDMLRNQCSINGVLVECPEIENEWRTQ